MLGTAESAVTIAMAPILKSEQVPNITSGQSVGLIAVHSPYLFLNGPTGLTYDTTLAKYLVTTKGYKKIAMLTNNDSYGAGEQKSFTTALQGLGVTPVASKVVPSGQTNMTPALTAIRGSGPQVLFIGAEEAQSGLIVKQARALGMNTVIAEGAPAGTPLFLSTAGPANANGTIVSSPYLGNNASSAAQKFAAAWAGEAAAAMVPAATVPAVTAVVTSSAHSRRRGRTPAGPAIPMTGTSDPLPELVSPPPFGDYLWSSLH